MSVREFQIVLLLLVISKSVDMLQLYKLPRKSTKSTVLSRMPIRHGKRSSSLLDDFRQMNEDQETNPTVVTDAPSTIYLKLQSTLSQLSFLLSQAARKDDEVKLEDKQTRMFYLPLLIVNPKAWPATSSLSTKKGLNSRYKGLNIFILLDDDLND